MTYGDFKQAVIGYAKEAGVAQYDLYYSNSASTSVHAFEGEVDLFSDNTSIGVCFRCIVDGRMGYSNTQQLSDDEARRLVLDAKAGTEIIETEGFAVIYAGDDKYADVPQGSDEGCDVEALKALAIDVEKQILAKDPRIVAADYALAEYEKNIVGLYNSNGLDLINLQSGYAIVGSAVAEADGRKYSGMGFQEYLQPSEADIPAVVEEAASLALGSIGASSVPSGSYPIVFTPKMSAVLLSCFTSVFSADAAQKGLSLLAGKEGETIANTALTLIDDPHYAGSANKTPFDDEGVATRVKAIIENGVLRTLLYDLKSAAKAGKASTGNGRKRGYVADVEVAPFVLRVQPGTMTQEQLLAQAGRAVLITEMKGMHASASPVTGDFSLEAKGYLVEDGKVSRPAEQFTIAGNFFQMIRDITHVGSDIKLTYGMAAAPSILVSSLMVAGE